MSSKLTHSDINYEEQRRAMLEEVEREHFQLIKETEQQIIKEEMDSLKEKLDLQRREARRTMEEKNLPYFMDLVKQLETGLLSSSNSISPSSSSSSNDVQGLIEEIKSLGEMYKTRMKVKLSTSYLNDENCDPRVNGRHSYDKYYGKNVQHSESFKNDLGCSPVEREVFMILKNANSVIHERMESAYEAIVTKLQCDEPNGHDENEARCPQKALEAIRRDMDQAKALCKRNLQTAVDIIFRGASSS